jgi:hypothetical protein
MLAESELCCASPWRGRRDCQQALLAEIWYQAAMMPDVTFSHLQFVRQIIDQQVCLYLFQSSKA